MRVDGCTSTVPNFREIPFGQRAGPGADRAAASRCRLRAAGQRCFTNSVCPSLGCRPFDRSRPAVESRQAPARRSAALPGSHGRVVSSARARLSPRSNRFRLRCWLLSRSFRLYLFSPRSAFSFSLYPLASFLPSLFSLPLLLFHLLFFVPSPSLFLITVLTTLPYPPLTLSPTLRGFPSPCRRRAGPTSIVLVALPA